MSFWFEDFIIGVVWYFINILNVSKVRMILIIVVINKLMFWGLLGDKLFSGRGLYVVLFWLGFLFVK